MKKIFLLVFTFSLFFTISCTKSYELEKMAEGVKHHMISRDVDKGTVTKITYIEALSYEKIPESERQSPNEVYLTKVYIRGTWYYYNSYRIFNIDDTIDCYFNKNKVFLRIGNPKEK